MDPCPKHGTHMDSCWDCCEEHWQDRIAELEAQLASLRVAALNAVEYFKLLGHPHPSEAIDELECKAQEGE